MPDDPRATLDRLTDARRAIMLSAKLHPPAAWVVSATGDRIGLERQGWKRNCDWLVKQGLLRPSPHSDFYVTDPFEAAVAALIQERLSR